MYTRMQTRRCTEVQAYGRTGARALTHTHTYAHTWARVRVPQRKV